MLSMVCIVCAIQRAAVLLPRSTRSLSSAEVCIEIAEELIPVREKVKGACEILGLDPLYVANEGKLVAIVSADLAEPLVARMRQHRYGADACIIGEVKAEPGGIVSMRTGFGGTRIVDMLVGEQLPRIC